MVLLPPPFCFPPFPLLPSPMRNTSLPCFSLSLSLPKADQPYTQNKIIRKPLNIATSKPAQKTYLNTILLLSTSAVLFGFAVVAYVIFYWNWIPAVGVEKDVWLVFE